MPLVTRPPTASFKAIPLRSSPSPVLAGNRPASRRVRSVQRNKVSAGELNVLQSEPRPLGSQSWAGGPPKGMKTPVWGRLATGGRLSIGPLGEQWANGEGRLQRSAEPTVVRTGLSKLPGEAGLPGRAPNGLCQRRRRIGKTHATLCRPRDECERAAVVSVQGDQPASVESDAVHAAFRFLETFFCPCGERSPSAHGAPSSLADRPFAASASSSIALHPAASKRATPTACFANAETLAAAPAAISARISASWLFSSVMVIFVGAIPKNHTMQEATLEGRLSRNSGTAGRHCCLVWRDWRGAVVVPIGMPEISSKAVCGPIGRGSVRHATSVNAARQGRIYRSERRVS
jgi:hypothetical protein